MKRVFVLVCALVILVGAVRAQAAKPPQGIKIQDGVLEDSQGNLITVGYDQWGYNYQAHMFNGLYANYTRPDVPVEDDDTNLSMKWNDAWLSNQSRDGDLLLDRHFGFDSYIGSGAWLTNHMSGVYEDEDGNEVHWTYFVKIVAAPADAFTEDGVWYAADGTEIGPVIWGDFAVVQEISNDPGLGEHGVLYKSPAGPGLGNW